MGIEKLPPRFKTKSSNEIVNNGKKIKKNPL